MPPTIITSANTSACSSSRAPSKAYHSQEHREYGATKHTSTSTRKGNVVIHNHNMGIEDASAPSPSSYGAARSRR